MTICRYCGSEGAYDSGFTVECPNSKCFCFSVPHTTTSLVEKIRKLLGSYTLPPAQPPTTDIPNTLPLVTDMVVTLSRRDDESTAFELLVVKKRETAVPHCYACAAGLVPHG